MTVNKFKSNFKKLDLSLHGVRLPAFSIDKESKRALKVSEDIDNYNFLKSLCKKGLDDLGEASNKKYTERLNYELKTLKDLSFVDYILLVWSVINFCKDSSNQCA